VGPRFPFELFGFLPVRPRIFGYNRPKNVDVSARQRTARRAFSTKQPDPAVTTRSAVDPRSVEARNPNVMACVAQIRGVPAAAAPRLSLLGNRRAGASPRQKEDSQPIDGPRGWI